MQYFYNKQFCIQTKSAQSAGWTIPFTTISANASQIRTNSIKCEVNNITVQEINKTRWSLTANHRPTTANSWPIYYCRKGCDWPLNLWPSKFKEYLLKSHLVFPWPWPLTSKSNQFTSVSKCSAVVNLLNFPQAVGQISCSLNFNTVMHTRMHGEPKNRMPLVVRT